MGVLALAGVATALPAAELSVNDFCFDGPLGSTRAPSWCRVWPSSIGAPAS